MIGPRVIGLDPSLTGTGICLPDGSAYTISTGTSKRGDARLIDIRKAMIYYLRRQSADMAVLEKPIAHNSADVTIILGMAQGVIREVLAEFEIPRAIVNLRTVKLFATGNGNADKAAMIVAANVNRGRDATPYDDNQADAWWLRQIGLYRLGARGLDPRVAGFLHADQVREQCVNGPWPKAQGITWPKLPRT